MKKNCIIFGGNGFIGSHLAEGLIKRGYSVRIFDKFPSGTRNLSNIIEDIEVISGDFLNKESVSDALDGMDILFHYISTTNPATSVDNPIYDIKTNIVGSIQLFQSAIEADVTRIIYPSSGGTIYGETGGGPINESQPLNPVNPYAISKLAIERYLYYFKEKFDVDFTILRYSNPYGERQNPYAKQGVIPIFLNKILKGESPVIYGDGTATRDYIYIKDAIDATIAVLTSDTKERVLNIGSGQETSLNDLIKVICEVTNKSCQPVYIDEGRAYISKFILDI